MLHCTDAAYLELLLLEAKSGTSESEDNDDGQYRLPHTSNYFCGVVNMCSASCSVSRTDLSVMRMPIQIDVARTGKH